MFNPGKWLFPPRSFLKPGLGAPSWGWAFIALHVTVHEMLSTSRKAGLGFFLLGGADSSLYENSKAAGALPTGKHLCLCCSIKSPGGPKGGLLQHCSLPGSWGSCPSTMRFLVLTSLLCILLLCLSVFSTEGRTLPCPRPGRRSLGRDSVLWGGGNQEMEGTQSWVLKDITPEPIWHLCVPKQHQREAQEA